MNEVRLRSPRFKDIFFLLRLRNQPDIVALSRSKRGATMRWFTAVRKWMQIVEVHGERVGYLLAIPRYEVSVALITAARGKGYGTAALKRLRGRFVARIHPTNAASIRAFQKAGFSQETECRVFFTDD